MKKPVKKAVQVKKVSAGAKVVETMSGLEAIRQRAIEKEGCIDIALKRANAACSMSSHAEKVATEAAYNAKRLIQRLMGMALFLGLVAIILLAAILAALATL